MRSDARGFTLIELLVVVAILALLAAMLTPAVARSLAAGRSAACASNLRQMQAGYRMYLDDHEGRLFPWRENRSEGVLWYWGLETARSGQRSIDRSQARLAPYLGAGTVETCPAFPYHAASFKQKFDAKTYGYGLNVYLLADSPEGRAAGLSTIDQVAKPASTIGWGDAIQVNTFQPPASPGNPMLEEWYYLASRASELPTFHFRHAGRQNVVMLDGSVQSLRPDRLLRYCDGQVGYPSPGYGSYLLQTDK